MSYENAKKKNCNFDTLKSSTLTLQISTAKVHNTLILTLFYAV